MSEQNSVAGVVGEKTKQNVMAKGAELFAEGVKINRQARAAGKAAAEAGKKAAGKAAGKISCQKNPGSVIGMRSGFCDI